jgi:hypothetical protein
MQYVLDHSEEIEKTLKVQAQVSEVKNIMLENIEKVYFIPSPRLCTRRAYDACGFVLFCS